MSIKMNRINNTHTTIISTLKPDCQLSQERHHPCDVLETPERLVPDGGGEADPLLYHPLVVVALHQPLIPANTNNETNQWKRVSHSYQPTRKSLPLLPTNYKGSHILANQWERTGINQWERVSNSYQPLKRVSHSDQPMRKGLTFLPTNYNGSHILTNHILTNQWERASHSYQPMRMGLTFLPTNENLSQILTNQ